MEEVNELINNCTNEWITQNGVSGRLFTGPNGNSIFLPAAGLRDGSELYGAGSYGEYWSSSLTDDPYYAWYLGFGSVDSNMDSYYRYCGQSVRPVCRFTPTVTTSIASSITTTGATLNGNITSDGGVTVTDRGFIYGTSESNLIHTVQSGSGTGTFSKTITGLTSVTTYYFKAYATNSEGTVYGEVRSFTTPTGGMGEHYYVDLGLPSGTCWATCNVGAASPEEYGNYYAWGETSTKTTYTEDNYTYSGNPTTLPSSADAATVNWGSGWRMPTQTEMNELFNNCTHVWTTQNGVYGFLFTSNINGNSIFLPGASDNALCTGCGMYWSSSLGTNSAVSLMVASEDYLFISDLFIARYYGLSVRPVCSNCGSSVATPTVTTVTASSITSTGATLSGNITTDGGAAVTSRGFLYGTNSSNLTQTVQSGSGTGSFAKALTGLTSGTTYYYKAYATNAIGTSYGEVKQFTTSSPSMPTVQTNNATSVSMTGATLNGNVTSDGGATVTDRGFLCGQSIMGFMITSQTVQCGSGTGPFTTNLTDLAAGITYCYKAYATNSEGTEYGEVMSFTTESSKPVVITYSASNINTAGATLSGNVTSGGGATVTDRGFIYGTNSSNLTQTVQSGNGTGNFTKVLTALTSGTTYYYKAYATNSVGTAYGENTGAATGTLNGHEWVELGLPSGLLWSTTNIGAENPEDYGNYYAWGETATKETYTWDTYSLCNGTSNTITKYCNDPNFGDNGFTDSLTILETTDDAAATNWGSGWRMPTQTEMQELIHNCTHEWTTRNGVNGRLFTGPNGNTIFLPAAGFRYRTSLHEAGYYGLYWSSSLVTGSLINAWGLFFDSDNCGSGNYNYRYYGRPVRPVCESPNPNATSYTVTFDANGGTGTMQPQTFSEGEAQNLTTNTFTKENYTFAGWNTAADGSGAAYTDGQSITISENVTLYAQWEESRFGSFTDTRDGNTYSTVRIGTQTWMADNLRYEGNIPLGSTTSTTTAYRYYPNNNSSNVAIYGYLYNWPAAMNGESASDTNPSGVRGICPNDWHLPSDAEWTQLTDYLSSRSEYQCDGMAENIAKSLASITGWNSSTNTCAVGNNPSDNNSTGFGALPAGFYNGHYINFGHGASFWCTSERSSSDADYRFFVSTSSTVNTDNNSNKGLGWSVRCVKD